MKKREYAIYVIKALALLIWCSACKPDTSSEQQPEPVVPERGVKADILSIDQPFIRRYQGLIDRKEVFFVLVNWGDGRLGGWMSYGLNGERKSLDGEVNLDETFLLEIFDDMDFEGSVRGSIATIEDLRGNWSNPDSTQVLPFSVQMLPVTEDHYGWSGIWYLNDTWDGGALLIGDVQGDAFTMALEVMRNGHYGYLEEVVPYENTKAILDKKLFSEEESCQLVLGKQSHQIQLYQPSSPSSCGFGVRASATGSYEREKRKVSAVLTYGDERSHFPSKKIHDDFRNMLGKKVYDEFAFRMQKHVRENKTRLSANKTVKGVKGWVAGLMTVQEAIVLFDEQGSFWAALIDLEDEKNPRIRYYTNDERMKNTLPVGIDAWRERFQEYDIIYPE